MPTFLVVQMAVSADVFINCLAKLSQLFLGNILLSPVNEADVSDQKTKQSGAKSPQL